MEHKSLAVAQCILDRCRVKEINHVTPMKLLKLLYISHGYMLGKHGIPLLEEPIRAFQYGPIVKSVYDQVRKNRSSNIPSIKVSKSYKELISEAEIKIIDNVISIYGNANPIQLSAAMHNEKTPWGMSRKISDNNPIISNDYIQYFYKELINSRTHSYL